MVQVQNCDHVAALTFWYDSYYEVCKGGQYFRITHERHAKYGQKFHGEIISISRLFMS